MTKWRTAKRESMSSKTIHGSTAAYSGNLSVPTIHGTTPAVYSAIVDSNDVSTEERKALGLPTTVKPLGISKQELGKLRRQHITVTKQLLACGHRVAVSIAPRNNCDACWLTHFRTIPGLTWTDDAGKPYDSVTPELVAQVTAARGAKFAKRLRWYLAVNAMMHVKHCSVPALLGESVVQSLVPKAGA